MVLLLGSPLRMTRETVKLLPLKDQCSRIRGLFTSNMKHDENKKPNVNKEVEYINMSDEEHKASDTGDEHGDDHMVFDEERSLKQGLRRSSHLMRQQFHPDLNRQFVLILLVI